MLGAHSRPLLLSDSRCRVSTHVSSNARHRFSPDAGERCRDRLWVPLPIRCSVRTLDSCSWTMLGAHSRPLAFVRCSAPSLDPCFQPMLGTDSRPMLGSDVGID